MRSFGALRPLLLAALAAIVSACASPTCGPFEGRPAHHGIGGFCNLPGAPEVEAGFVTRAVDGLRLVTARERGPVPPQFYVPPAEAIAALRAPSGGDRMTWLGHASVLLEVGGRRILTDPVLSTYVTPVPPIGPKRVAPPPIPVSALPPIDVILITHNHFDHLDRPTMEAIPGKDRIEVVVPLGLARLVRSMGYARVTEIDWWQSGRFAGLEITALPAAHESQRRPFVQDETLWAGFAIQAPGPSGRRIVVSGDSGYHTHFAEIGRRLGPFDLAVMYLGGYGPREVAKARHFTPRQMVLAVDDLRARQAVPVHWGTYPLGAEPTFKPGPAFLEMAAAAGWDEGRARLMRVGETRAIGGPRLARR